MRLTLNDVSIGYDTQEPLQRYVNFSVESGEVCCLLGPNGCGKTTLVRSILGMMPLLGGRVSIDGADITTWSAQRLSKQVAYVAQRASQPFPYEVRDVVMLGRVGQSRGLSGQPDKHDYNIVENAMREMGIYHLRAKSFLDISGGELQLVMFARALAQEPELLILDEPTAALDYGNAVHVIDTVRSLAKKGYAVMMITHNPDHAFMTKANVALFTRYGPMKFGDANSIITRENIQEAYGVGVKLVEFTHENKEIMRMCAPVFGGRD
jgi:iron complex transport system ATP-binding protein